MKNVLFTILFVITSYTGIAQNVGIGTNSPNASAVLDASSTTQGFLPPRMTYAQRNAIVSPAAGLIVYCTDCGGGVGELNYFNGTNWVSTSSIINLPSVNTDLAHDISTDSAICSGSINSDGGYSVVSKGICWSLNPNPSISGFHTDEGPGASPFTSSMHNLLPDTLYYYRAYARNSLGTSYGITYVFNTLSFYLNTTQTPIISVPIDKHWKVRRIVIPYRLTYDYSDNPCWPSGPSYGCNYCGINHEFARLGSTSISKTDITLSYGYNSNFGCQPINRTMNFNQSDVNISLPFILNPGEQIISTSGILIGIEEY